MIEVKPLRCGRECRLGRYALIESDWPRGLACGECGLEIFAKKPQAVLLKPDTVVMRDGVVMPDTEPMPTTPPTVEARWLGYVDLPAGDFTVQIMPPPNLPRTPAGSLAAIADLLNPVDANGEPLEPLLTTEQAKKLLEGK